MWCRIWNLFWNSNRIDFIMVAGACVVVYKCTCVCSPEYGICFVHCLERRSAIINQNRVVDLYIDAGSLF